MNHSLNASHGAVDACPRYDLLAVPYVKYPLVAAYAVVLAACVCGEWNNGCS